MSVRTSSAAAKTTLAASQTTHSAAFQHLHRGVQRRRQQDRDQDPREHLPGEVAEEQHHDDQRRDSENREDGPRVHVDNTSLRSHHAGKFVVLPRVPGVRPSEAKLTRSRDEARRELRYASTVARWRLRPSSDPVPRGTPARTASNCAATAIP